MSDGKGLAYLKGDVGKQKYKIMSKKQLVIKFKIQRE